MVDTRIVKAEQTEGEELHLVYGEVYAPDRPDAQGEYMTAEEIRKMCHSFARSGRLDQIDVMHNNKVAVGCHVVESFIASKNDDTFIPGSWVVAVHVPDDELWEAIKEGKLNGFSMESLVVKEDKEVILQIPPVVSGLTSKSEGHIHKFYVSYDKDGTFVGGKTDVVDGHMHAIRSGTCTEEAKNHTHRFSSVDDLHILQED